MVTADERRGGGGILAIGTKGSGAKCMVIQQNKRFRVSGFDGVDGLDGCDWQKHRLACEFRR